MIIQAELRQKQSEYEGEACVVDKVIELPAQRFKQFSCALLADYDFIAENKKAIQYEADSRHCLLILDVVGTDGFLVDPQGYNYARYSAFVPNVRSLLTPDVEIDRSYLSLAEPWRDESRDEMLRMTLRVDEKPDYTLVLPADEIYLDAVKAYLDIDVFADAMIEDVRFKILHWHMQAGNVVIPGSKNPEHIKANFDLFDFELTADEMAQIAAMNQNKRYYTSTPELLKKYAEMVPPVDEQK